MSSDFLLTFKEFRMFFSKKSRRVFGSACNVFIGGKCDKDIYAFLSLFWRFMYRRMFRSACNVFGGVRNVCSLICFFPALISRLAIYLPQNVLLLFAFYAIIIIIIITRPRPAFGRLGLGGSLRGYSSHG